MPLDTKAKPAFDKAPPEVVEEQKERPEEGRALRRKLTTALSRLAG